LIIYHERFWKQRANIKLRHFEGHPFGCFLIAPVRHGGPGIEEYMELENSIGKQWDLEDK